MTGPVAEEMNEPSIQVSDRTTWILLTVLVAVALVLRLYNLGDLPSGLYCSAMTHEGIPHALRSIGSLPFLEITAAVGIVAGVEFLRKRSRRMGGVLASVIALSVLANTVLFTWKYFGEYHSIHQIEFQYGLKEAIALAEAESENYDHIVMSPLILQAYIFVLFYAKPDPTEYQQHGTLGKYIVNSKENNYPPGRYLFVVTRSESMPGKRPLHVIRGDNDMVFLQLYEHTFR